MNLKLNLLLLGNYIIIFCIEIYRFSKLLINIFYNISTCCSLQKKSSLNGSSQTNHSSPFQKNLLNTIMRCSNDKIKIFSMSINGNDFQTIKSLSEDGKITIIDANTISILTNLDELVTISIIHTKKSPLSPLADRNS